MLGTVSAYNENTGKGLVEAPNGVVYFFDSRAISDGCIPYKGMTVYFDVVSHTKLTNQVDNVSAQLPRFNWRALASIALICVLAACMPKQGDKGDSIVGPAGKDGQSIVGPPGADGQSIVGPTGPQGPQGQDLANVRVVQFCPAQGASSTGHFPEYGICISNKLYGVFDDSFHTWLAEVVPGTYQSTSTGLICTFIVTANCGVL